MRKLNLILICFLILAVMLSGCTNKQTPEQLQQKPASSQELEGNFTVPEGLDIEDVQTSEDENVDLGSLI